ncbi:MAG: MarR family transcriptional regulator, partial [Nevskia sp.]|nr:MarR family transcriptional regulator [Nevskia sp.]
MPEAASTEAVADRLHSVAIHLLRELRQEDLALGLGPTQLSALSVLVFGGPQTIGALARIEQVALPTISRLVDALAAAGLAARETDAVDRRIVRVSATPA